MDALREDLLAWLDGRPVSARAPTLRYRAGRFLRRNALAVGAAGVVVVALCAGLGVALWQAREARLQAQRADVVNAYLVDVFRSIDPDEGLGPDATVRQLIDQGVARLDRGELRGQPGAEGRLRLTLADSYVALGDYPKANAELRRALALLPASQADDIQQARYRQGELLLEAEDLDGLQRNLDGQQAWLARHAAALAHPEEAAANLQLLRAKLLGHRERYPEAVALAKAAWQRMQRLRGADDPQTRSMLVEYSVILSATGAFADAAAMTKVVADGIRRSTPVNEYALATALHNEAVYLSRAGETSRAIATEREALAIRRRLLPPTHPFLAVSIGELAVMLESTDNAAASLPLHAEAVAIMRRQPPAAAYDLGLRINNWGVACYNLGDMDCARARIAEAIAVWSAALPADHSSLLTARSNLAALLSRGGDLRRGEEQLRLVAAALEAVDAAKPSVDTLGALSNARNELADNLLAQGRNAEALAVSRTRWDALQRRNAPLENTASALAMLALAELANDLDAAALGHARTAVNGAHAAAPDSRVEAFALLARARAQLALGDPYAATDDARKAASMYATAVGADHRSTALARGVLGRALLASGERASGRREVDAAIDILASKAAWLPELAELRRLRQQR